MTVVTDKSQTQDSAVISFVSLGCPKNVVDAETMLGSLLSKGYHLSADPSHADVIIVNTCAFIEDARKESVAHIQEMATFKRYGKCSALIVSGCMAQRYADSLMEEVPDIDGMLGVSRLEAIDDLCRTLIAKKKSGAAGKETRIADPDDLDQTYQTRLRIGSPHTAHLKISEGCNQKCAFCAIPSFRGLLKSRPIEDVVREARDLVELGAREIILISQDSTSYGKDIYDKRRLADLSRELTRIDGLDWLRIMYHYPTSYPMDLIDEIAQNDKIVNYIDIPLQHINDEVLLRMKRGNNRAKIESLLQTMRDRIPGLVLRTTFLVGFPGETDEQYDELLDFVQDFRFDRMGCFAFSREKGTKSDGMDGQVPEEVKIQRRDELMAVQQEIAYENNRARVGTTCDVMVDGYDEVGEHYIGRSYGDAPEIDNQIYFRAGGRRRPEVGEIHRVKITKSLGYDLAGKQQSKRNDD